MYARLNAGFGWSWKDEDGSLGPFVLSGAYRYAGMVSGKAPDGRSCARPLSEFDALSIDGITWQPFAELRELIPWENQHVQQRIVLLPDIGPGTPGTSIPRRVVQPLHSGGGSDAGDPGTRPAPVAPLYTGD